MQPNKNNNKPDEKDAPVLFSTNLFGKGLQSLPALGQPAETTKIGDSSVQQPL